MSVFKNPLKYLFILITLTGVSACNDQKEVGKTEQIRPVKSIVVGESVSGPRWTFPGKVQAFEKVDLSFQVSGQLKMLNVLAGQSVKKGEVLAKLDQRNYAAEVKAAQAELDRSSAEFSRMEPLLEKQLVSQSEYDQKKAQRDIAEANLDQAQKALEDTELTAPFSGVIAGRFVENFEDITAKQAILSLQNPNTLEVTINIPENRIVAIENQRDQIQAFAKTSNEPDKKYALDLREYSSEVDPVTQTFEVILNLTKNETDKIFAGMSVEVLLETDDKTAQSYWIPESAVIANIDNLQESKVWVLTQIDNELWQAQSRVVEAKELSKENIEIISGLNKGERIVTAGANYLHEGDKVKLYVGDTL